MSALQRLGQFRVHRWMLRRLALFLSILLSGGLLLFPRLPMLGLIIVLTLVVSRGYLPLRRPLLPLLGLLAWVFILTLIRPGPLDVESLVIRFANFLASLLMLDMYLRTKAGAFTEDLRSLLLPMAWQSIGTVLLAHTIGAAFLSIDIAGISYRTLLLLFTYHQTLDEPTGLIRPDGFFFEPGVFQIYLNLGLYLSLFAKRNLRHALLFLLAVWATQSTTGIVISLVIFGSGFYNLISVVAQRYRLAFLLVACMAAPILIYFSYINVAEKFFGELQGSWWARQYDLITGINVALNHPWLGIGFDHSRYLEASGFFGFEDTQLSNESLAERSSSNGLVQVFYMLGIPTGLVFLWGVVRQRLFAHRSLIAFWLLMSMIGEALVFTPFFLLIVFSAFVSARPLKRLFRTTPLSHRPST